MDRKQQMQQRDPTLIPLTLKMLWDAYKSTGENKGPDAQLLVSGKELTMFTFVACVESVQQQATFRCYNVNDSTARIPVKCYQDADMSGPGGGCDVRPGSWVRIFGTLR